MKFPLHLFVICNNNKKYEMDLQKTNNLIQFLIRKLSNLIPVLFNSMKYVNN